MDFAFFNEFLELVELINVVDFVAGMEAVADQVVASMGELDLIDQTADISGSRIGLYENS